jgi:hypothetical protein
VRARFLNVRRLEEPASPQAQVVCGDHTRPKI